MTLSIYGQTNAIREAAVWTDPLSAGVSITKSTGTIIREGVVRACKLRGIGDFGSGTHLLRLVVTGNGHDGAPYNGDGILLQGAGGEVGWCSITDNGDSPDYEHGIYIAAPATAVNVHDCLLAGNSCSGIKVGGAGLIERCQISGSSLGLVFDGDVAGDATIRNCRISATKYAIQVDANTRLGRFHSDYNTFDVGARFSNKGTVLDLAGWQKATGLDLHSGLV